MVLCLVAWLLGWLGGWLGGWLVSWLVIQSVDRVVVYRGAEQTESEQVAESLPPLLSPTSSFLTPLPARIQLNVMCHWKAFPKTSRGWALAAFNEI